MEGIEESTDKEKVEMLIRRAVYFEKQLLPPAIFKLFRRDRDVNKGEIKKSLLETINGIKDSSYGALEYINVHDAYRLSKLYGIDMDWLIDKYVSLDRIETLSQHMLTAPEFNYFNYYSSIKYNEKNNKIAREVLDKVIESIKYIPEISTMQENKNGKLPATDFPHEKKQAHA